MAKRFGIELRNELKFRDHEGQIINQGDLFIDDEPVAFWTQDAAGGADVLKMEPGFSEAAFREEINKMHPEPIIMNYAGLQLTVEYSLEMMMNELVKLTDAERALREARQRGYNALLFISDGGDAFYWELYDEEPLTTDEAIFKHEDLVAQSQAEFDEDQLEIRYYTDDSQFDVGPEISTDALMKGAMFADFED